MQPEGLKLGTRGSPLALVQSEWVASQIRQVHPGIALEIVKIVTGGDRSQADNTPLSSYSEKGIFAKEIELTLLAGEIDLAVHSMKDMAAQLPNGLTIAAVPVRENVRDVMVGAKLADLPSGSRVGTGSARRRAILSSMRPDLTLLEIRGNVDTRIAKLQRGEYDAIVLAAAGLKRLGRESVIAEYLDPEIFVPDPGQGALAIETRSHDQSVIDFVMALNDPDTQACVTAERAFLSALGAGCSTPVGAWARIDTNPGLLKLTAMRANERGEISLVELTAPKTDPDLLGKHAAQGLE